MIHFFLHGGDTSTAGDRNRSFFQDSCRDGDKVLIIPFAGEEDKWNDMYDMFMNRCIQYNPDKQLTFTLASPDIPTLIQQIKENNVLLIPGAPGTIHLINKLSQITELRDLLQNKTIAGVSAGTNAWSTHYYSQRLEKLQHGLGILPIKTIVHRGANRHPGLSNEERIQILDEYGEKLPIYTIPEGEYIELKMENGKLKMENGKLKI